MNTAPVDINGRAVHRIEYRDKPVITMPMVDDLHERPKGTAKRNFRQNKKYLVEDEDYFLISGKELEGVRNSSPLDARINKLILLTESGYLMLVKSFTDDLAWQVQRALVNRYFAREPALPDRRVEINHRRATNAPDGLDIRYTLDLTKVCMNPSRKNLTLVSRLTGIDLDDLIEDATVHELLSTPDGSIQRFVNECLKQDPSARITAADLHERYAIYCAKHKIPPESTTKLGSWMRVVFEDVKKIRQTMGGSKRTIYLGVGVR